MKKGSGSTPVRNGSSRCCITYPDEEEWQARGGATGEHAGVPPVESRPCRDDESRSDRRNDDAVCRDGRAGAFSESEAYPGCQTRPLPIAQCPKHDERDDGDEERRFPLKQPPETEVAEGAMAVTQKQKDEDPDSGRQKRLAPRQQMPENQPVRQRAENSPNRRKNKVIEDGDGDAGNGRNETDKNLVRLR